MVAEKKTRTQQDIPDYLVREIIGGQRFYYRGYREVLNQKKEFEAIVGSSSLQALLSAYVMLICTKQKLYERYEILAGTPGLAIDPNNHLVCNCFFFDPTVLTPDKISTHYADVPPILAFTIDDKVEVASSMHVQYIRRKIDALLHFGTEKIIWILTASQQVMVAVPSQPWLTYDWNESIELLDGVTFNIGEYLKKKSA